MSKSKKNSARFCVKLHPIPRMFRTTTHENLSRANLNPRKSENSATLAHVVAYAFRTLQSPRDAPTSNYDTPDIHSWHSTLLRRNHIGNLSAKGTSGRFSLRRGNKRLGTVSRECSARAAAPGSRGFKPHD